MNMTNVFIDPRDKQVYRTVTIGNQIWLAENLRYKGPTQKFNNWAIEEKDFYYPPDGKQKNISNMGCFYTWKNALKAVPEGWHLPSKEDFISLLSYSGSDKAKQFQALAVPDWNGDNTLGFGAVPAGGHYYLFSCCAYFWSITEVITGSAYAYYVLFLGDGYADVRSHHKDDAVSVRCIKD